MGLVGRVRAVGRLGHGLGRSAPGLNAFRVVDPQVGQRRGFGFGRGLVAGAGRLLGGGFGVGFGVGFVRGRVRLGRLAGGVLGPDVLHFRLVGRRLRGRHRLQRGCPRARAGGHRRAGDRNRRCRRPAHRVGIHAWSSVRLVRRRGSAGRQGCGSRSLAPANGGGSAQPAGPPAPDRDHTVTRSRREHRRRA